MGTAKALELFWTGDTSTRALDLISSHLAVVRYTEDHKEGVHVFKEKRPPRFTGR